MIGNFRRASKPSEEHQKRDQEISARLIAASHQSVEELFHTLKTSEKGLSQSEAQQRIERYGLNRIASQKPPSWSFLLFKNFANPFIVLVMILGIVSFFLKEYNAVYIIAFIVLLSVLMRFIQEYRSHQAAEKLKALVSTNATVLRSKKGEPEPKYQEIAIKYLVPGDLIHLSAGDMVPADVRLLTAKELYVSQASLSGEALPVEKGERAPPKEERMNPLDSPNLCLHGTTILNGTAQALVLATGDQTYLGTMAKILLADRPLTSFDRGVNRVSWLLIQFICLMAPVVLLINGLSKGNWFEALLFSLSVAVGLTPEMLPMIVTANLARGAVKMARSQVIVKRLNSIQNFGAMDLLCTDKTGTLTENRIVLLKYLDVDGEKNPEILYYGYLNSFYQTGLKNLLDSAVLEQVSSEKREEFSKSYQKYDEIPFDFARRRMSVIIQKGPGSHLLICKGAVEEMLVICDRVRKNGSIQQIDAEMKSRLEKMKEELNRDGLRVLAVAYKELPEAEKREYRPEDERALIFFGYLAFFDPPKLSAAKALALLNTYAVQVKVMTGDNELVTEKICKELNLPIKGILTGPQIDALQDEELKARVEETTLFAKLTPLQKSRIIRTFKAMGHTVGYLGDGINDAPALREADIGISVDTAVDIAKESADIIMLEKSLLFLGEGVLEGRRTFANIMKYIKMTLSSNFGNVFSIVGASALLPFLPMLSIQILFQNMLYDLSQTLIPFDNVDPELLQKPRRWEPGGIAQFMVWIGPISSLFDYATFAVLWFLFSANTPAKQAFFQSGWFLEGLLSQVLIIHLIRTAKVPFLQSRASLPLLLSTLLIMGFGLSLPYTWMGASIGLIPLPSSYFPWLFLILISYCISTQWVKIYFIRRFHAWI
jgi:P-type Mg2+ transporter